ncbi:MAG: recombinase family protein [Oscillospiraceae bacterium]|nr:recombinase family protein [Oscillospiraceae bacterium]
MNSVAIYVRLSDEDMDKQGNIDSRSIINQKSMLTAYCREHEWDIFDIYCDDGITGMERERPEFQRMLKDCEDKKVNIVLCKDQSRFARDKILITEYLQTKFIIWGIRFIGVTDNVDSTSGYFLEQTDMNAMFNEWYVRNTSIKVNAVFEDMRRQGKFTSGHAPYGYIRDPADKHHFIPDENVRDIVVRIFDTFNTGASIKSIAVALNEEGIPCPSVYKKANRISCGRRNQDGLWTVTGISDILHNEVYTGTAVQGKTKKRSYRSKEITVMPEDEWIRVPHMHEPLITDETWKKAKARLDSDMRASSDKHEVSPLSRKVICAECGKPMHQRKSYNKRKNGGKVYYSMICMGPYNGKNLCGNNRSVSLTKIEQLCVDEINRSICSFCRNDSLKITQMQKELLHKLEEQKKQITSKRDKVQKRLDSLYTDKLDGVITADEYMHYKEQFSSELTGYDEQLRSVEKQISQKEEHMCDTEYRSRLINKYSDITHMTKGIADDFIDSVIVGSVNEDGSRDIHINIKI